MGMRDQSVAGPRAGRRPRLLAVSSGGGHWVQLLRVMPAFSDYQVTYATVDESYRQQVPGCQFHVVNDANRWSKIGLMRLAWAVGRIVLRERPDLIVSTGAAPGYMAIRIGKLLGIRSIWIDSVANAQRLSLSGRLVAGHADLWLTQWPHLQSPKGPWYAGAVL